MSIEDLKKKKMEDLQNQSQIVEHQRNVQAIEDMAKQQLTKDALERFGNIKAAYPEKANQLSLMLAQMTQTGQLQTKISDKLLKQILQKLTVKKNIKITRK